MSKMRFCAALVAAMAAMVCPGGKDKADAKDKDKAAKPKVERKTMAVSNLDDRHWYAGTKIAKQDLVGKVVMVYAWHPSTEESLAQLGRIEKIWASFATKPFQMIGTRNGARDTEAVAKEIAAKKVTFPVYESATPGDVACHAYPWCWVLDHHGFIVYSGKSERDATEALVNAITAVGAPPCIIPDVDLVKYKSLAKVLVLGNKGVGAQLKKLEKDIAKAEKKSATKIDKEKAEEAQAILAAIDKGKADVKAEIEALKTTNPPDAVKFAKLYIATFPDDAEPYKTDLPAMTEAAKAWQAEQKAAKAAAKASAKTPAK